MMDEDTCVTCGKVREDESHTYTWPLKQSVHYFMSMQAAQKRALQSDMMRWFAAQKDDE